MVRAAVTGAGSRLPRSFFARDPLLVAPDLLGKVLTGRSADGTVAIRLTEVEAYAGRDDPASHAFRGPTPRTRVMFGPPGHLYLYFVYGMHWCMNVVTGVDGEASAVLLRAGEVIGGLDVVTARRPAAREPRLARGPAALTAALGLDGRSSGLDLCDPAAGVELGSGRTGPPPPDEPALIRTGPRVGVSAGVTVPWRYWLAGEPSVSAYRSGGRVRGSRPRRMGESAGE